MNYLLEQSENLVDQAPGKFKRYLFDKIEWENRLIGIKGARGTGKTTLLLQWLSQKGLPSHQAAYFTLDDLYFLSHSLVDTARNFYKLGGQILVLDEVHKYPGWAREIKNLYDLYPELQIIFTGSSVVDISRQEGDLSRRALMNEIHGLSFREYLQFTGVLDLPAIPLTEITNPGNKLNRNLPKGFRPIQYFRK